MLDTFKNLQAGRLEQCENKFAYPILRWMSGAVENLDICLKANILFFKVSPQFIFSLLYSCPKKGFLKYPKKTKSKEDETLAIITPYLKKLYGWGDNELSANLNVINILIDKPEFIEMINDKIGIDKSDAKKLGLNFKVKKYEYKKPEPTKNLFSF